VIWPLYTGATRGCNGPLLAANALSGSYASLLASAHDCSSRAFTWCPPRACTAPTWCTQCQACANMQPRSHCCTASQETGRARRRGRGDCLQPVAEQQALVRRAQAADGAAQAQPRAQRRRSQQPRLRTVRRPCQVRHRAQQLLRSRRTCRRTGCQIRIGSPNHNPTLPDKGQDTPPWVALKCHACTVPGAACVLSLLRAVRARSRAGVSARGARLRQRAHHGQQRHAAAPGRPGHHAAAHALARPAQRGEQLRPRRAAAGRQGRRGRGALGLQLRQLALQRGLRGRACARAQRRMQVPGRARERPGALGLVGASPRGLGPTAARAGGRRPALAMRHAGALVRASQPSLLAVTSNRRGRDHVSLGGTYTPRSWSPRSASGRLCAVLNARGVRIACDQHGSGRHPAARKVPRLQAPRAARPPRRSRPPAAAQAAAGARPPGAPPAPPPPSPRPQPALRHAGRRERPPHARPRPACRRRPRGRRGPRAAPPAAALFPGPRACLRRLRVFTSPAAGAAATAAARRRAGAAAFAACAAGRVARGGRRRGCREEPQLPQPQRCQLLHQRGAVGRKERSRSGHGGQNVARARVARDGQAPLPGAPGCGCRRCAARLPAHGRERSQAACLYSGEVSAVPLPGGGAGAGLRARRHGLLPACLWNQSIHPALPYHVSDNMFICSDHRLALVGWCAAAACLSKEPGRAGMRG